MILSRINVELSSHCNKSCPMCGRRKLEKGHPDKCDWGDMPVKLAYKIAEQIPPGTIVQLHNNGESLLHPHFGRCLSFFKHCITGLNSNGILLVEKAEELIGNIDTLTISVIQDDDPQLAKEQLANVRNFLKLKGDRKPNMVYRLLGKVDEKIWKQFPGIVATRPLHSVAGSFDYEKPVTIPEMGICLDLLTSVSIDRFGRVFPCVRFNPDGLSQIGDVNHASLAEIVNSIESQPWQKGKHLRKHYVSLHVQGRRSEVPLCEKCEFYGVPRGVN
ncbi:MAG: SPASM domain-containing protein [Dehalococcoidia bacterium]